MKMKLKHSNLPTTPLLLLLSLSLSACGSCTAEEDEEPPVVQRPDVCEISPADVLDCEIPPKESEDAFVVINSSKDLEPVCASRCNRFYSLSVFANDFTFEDLSFFSHIIRANFVSFSGYIRALRGTEQLDIGGFSASGTFLLREIDGFSGATELLGVSIIENEDLEAVRGFDNVVTFESARLKINSNYKLKVIDAFNKLPSISEDGTIELQNNPQLQSIEGFRSLTQGQFLIIVGNPNLTKLSGLSNIQDFEQVRIEANAKLTKCEIDRTLAKLNPEVRVVLSNNGPDGPCPD